MTGAFVVSALHVDEGGAADELDITGLNLTVGGDPVDLGRTVRNSGIKINRDLQRLANSQNSRVWVAEDGRLLYQYAVHIETATGAIFHFTDLTGDRYKLYVGAAGSARVNYNSQDATITRIEIET